MALRIRGLKRLVLLGLMILRFEVDDLYDGAMIHSYTDFTGRNLLIEPDEARLKAYFGE